ncbi:MAG: DUF6229 family protein [Actinomycetota bacterium]|nr:DUF6229 family protein [Actinomycetota bacterium]MDQ2955573.1 DUF6229 family protein [Actinomycetota bacterium]
MTSPLLTRPEALVDAWRTIASGDNPAGPLFSSKYAESELTGDDSYALSCSACTASRPGSCC